MSIYSLGASLVHMISDQGGFTYISYLYVDFVFPCKNHKYANSGVMDQLIPFVGSEEGVLLFHDY